MEELAVKKQMSLQECLDDLQSEIKHGKNRDFFKVYSIETSGGKTYNTIKAIKDHYIFVKDNTFIQDKKRRFIFVSKFIDEGIEVAKNINKDEEEKIAMFYTPDKKIKDENCSSNFFECAKANTLILTHAMYIKLCNPKRPEHEEYRKIFLKYKTLIIDEEINPVKDSLFTFSQGDTYWLTTLDSFTEQNLSKKLYQLMKPLLTLLKEDYKPENQLHRVECDYDRKEVDKLYEELMQGVQNIRNELFEDKYKCGETKCQKENLFKLLNGILLTYDSIDDNICLINPKRQIFSYNYKFDYLMLNNNIWLDASANFNKMYENGLFKVIDCPREIDHTNSKLIFHKIKTTTSSKNIDENFRKDISEYLIEKYSDQEILILSKDVECQQLAEKEEYLKNYPNFKYSNFEAMRGKNDWKDLEVCCYIHTYRWTSAYYIFLYEYFNDVILPDNELITSNRKFVFTNKKSKSEWGFEKEELYELMISDMSSSMYQGLKRVQRNKQPEAIFDVFTDSINTIMTVKKQLYGIETKKNFIIADKGKQTDADKLKEYIKEHFEENEDKWIKVKSSDVMEQLEIGKSNWSKLWSKDELFKQYSKDKRLKQSQLKNDDGSNKKVNWIIKY
ncbi:hypothetical protein [Clostridium beijerinckii]|uniref:Uncharacterized protein n=1 Tax=Clostridium beijerinckii TaxID=1520 RepID=A0AAX0B803_CLOBE|nr:hypothetical protein [Clostridium beijerinckii]NRT91490.1 hypothetical protein [Clostridium beijerinckii]NYC71015.1 hypothetical protein [Clostridium beijerinckii]